MGKKALIQVFLKILAIVLPILTLSGAGVYAQKAFKDFTFKRVPVENRPIGSKINIQITPQAEPAPVSPPPVADAPAKPADLQDWFWADVSPKLDDASADRMAQAVAQLQEAPNGRFRFDIEHMQTIARTYGKEILIASLDKRVSPALVLAVIGVESSGNAQAESTAGAKGLMQLIPATAARFKVDDATDPQQNISGGTAYLHWLLDEFNGDPLLALAGYNAGENAVKNHAGIPPYAETRAYVPKVVAAWQIARTLCATPPELVSDGCVFSANAVK